MPFAASGGCRGRRRCGRRCGCGWSSRNPATARSSACGVIDRKGLRSSNKRCGWSGTRPDAAARATPWPQDSRRDHPGHRPLRRSQPRHPQQPRFPAHVGRGAASLPALRELHRGGWPPQYAGAGPVDPPAVPRFPLPALPESTASRGGRRCAGRRPFSGAGRCGCGGLHRWDWPARRPTQGKGERNRGARCR